MNKLLFALFFAVILGASASGFSMAGGGSSEGDLSKAGGERLFTVAKDFLKPVFAFRFSNEGGRVSVDRVVLYDSFLQKQGGSGDFTMELRNSRKQPVFSAKFSFTKTVLSDSPECFGSASGVLDGGSGGSFRSFLVRRAGGGCERLQKQGNLPKAVGQLREIALQARKRGVFAAVRFCS